MQFRPCIDIHNGKVKQIVGSSLRDENDQAKENFVSEKGAEYYAALYRDHGLKGGHVIMLNSVNSEYYNQTKKEAISALAAFPGGLQIGGGINDRNAKEFIDSGASHVIVTSYLFENGRFSYEKMQKLADAVGKEHVVFDLSVRRFEDGYHIMADRWQTKTDEVLSEEVLNRLGEYCDEFLIHAVDVEGSAKGIEEALIQSLKGYEKHPLTYAGGVHSMDDLKLLKRIGEDHIHVTVGSALDLFGGDLKFTEVLKTCEE